MSEDSYYSMLFAIAISSSDMHVFFIFGVHTLILSMEVGAIAVLLFFSYVVAYRQPGFLEHINYIIYFIY